MFYLPFISRLFHNIRNAETKSTETQKYFSDFEKRRIMKKECANGSSIYFEQTNFHLKKLRIEFEKLSLNSFKNPF